MKIARFFAAIFACIGTLLLIGSMGFFLLNRNADVRIQELPQKAVSVSDAFSQALNGGDLEAAAQLMYGQPDLGLAASSDDPETALVWDAFCGGIAFSYSGDCYVDQGTLVRKGTITTMNISSVLETLPERTQALLNQRITTAEALTDIYDENNDFRQELVDAVMREALQQSLSQDAQPVTREVTVKLTKRDGQWWVVPHQNLLQILTGLA